MTKTKFGITFFILLSLSLIQVAAQQSSEKVSLISVLNKLQEKLGCSFSYIDNELDGFYILPPSSAYNLKENIDYLRQHSFFDFTFLDKKNIAISYTTEVIEVCGILKSEEDATPITNANITGTKTSTITDQNGEFNITFHSPEDNIKISYLGYSSINISLKDLKPLGCTELFLIPEVQFLNKIILKDFITSGINTSSDGSITIDYKDFGILPGLIEPDVLQTVQALPGILSVNETVSNINVRGGTNDQNLILWDGIKMYQSGHFFGLISAFNPYLTKNVQLIKNGSSAQYGDGVSSIISMQTENNVSKKINAGLGVNLISADGYVDTPISSKSSVQFAIRSSINDIIQTPTYDNYFTKVFQDSEVLGGSNENFSFYDTSLRWVYQPTEKDLLKVNGILMRNALVFQETNTINTTPISRESNLKQNNIAGGIYYTRNWNPKHETEFMLYGTNYKLEAFNVDILNNQRLLQQNEVLEGGFKVTSKFKLNTRINLTNGYQYNETGITDFRDLSNPTFSDLTKEVIRTNSAFSEFEYRSSNEKTYIRLGGRINHFDKFNKTIVEPRVSISQDFLDHFTFQFLGELKSQVTSQIINLQNDFLGVENRKWVLSNTNDIPILRSNQISTGINYTHNNWLISAEAYYKRVNGIITLSQGFQNQYQNIRDHGNYTVKGIDFLLSKKFRKFSTWISYSYATNDYEFNTLSHPNFPNNIDIRHNFNLTVAYNYDNFKLSTGLNWHSGKPTTRPAVFQSDTDQEINFLPPNHDTLPDYFRWDFSGTYSFKISNKLEGMGGVSIWNLLNTNNIISNYYNKDQNNSVYEIQEKGLQLTPNAVFRINF